VVYKTCSSSTGPLTALALVWQRTTFLKKEKIGKNVSLKDDKSDCANAGRERDRMAGAAPEAGADIQGRRHCVGRADIWIHDDTIVSMGDELKECLPWVRHGVRGGVKGNGGTNDKSMWEGQIRGRTAPFLLTNPDFSKTEMVKAYSHTVVAPPIDYWKHTIEVKKGDQVEWMKRVSIFNPVHVLTNKIWVSDIEGIKIFKVSHHPQIMMQIEVMKNEVITYQTSVDSIKPLVEGQDTFDISDWWKANCAKLPAFTYVLCAVLTNSHNSCPPECLFTIGGFLITTFNSTFDADQKSSYTDYIQLLSQSQFNNRTL
jgi:hypothetical protein